MAAAAAVSEIETKFSRERRAEIARMADSSTGRLAQAFLVLQFREDLVGDVIAGVETLDVAYAKAKARKDGKDTDEARMAMLQAEAP